MATAVSYIAFLLRHKWCAAVCSERVKGKGPYV